MSGTPQDTKTKLILCQEQPLGRNQSQHGLRAQSDAVDCFPTPSFISFQQASLAPLLYLKLKNRQLP